MHLIYFDENKYSKENPFFTIGGILVPEAKVLELDSTLEQIQSNFFGGSSLVAENEFHGKEMIRGEGAFRGRKLPPLRSGAILGCSRNGKIRRPVPLWKCGTGLEIRND